MDPIKVYTLGNHGVVVDKSPIHNADGEWAKTQNAIRDPLGLLGGIHKRPGLVKFSSSVAAGSIIGGIGVPLVLLATSIGGVTLPGAGGDTPRLVGPAAGEGGGDTTGSGVSGGGGGGAVASGSGSSGGGSAPPTSGRKIFMGRSTTGANFGATQGWWTFVNPPQTGVMPAAAIINIGSVPDGTAPVSPMAGGTLTALDNTNFGLLTGSPGRAAVVNNKLYYPGSDYTPGTTEPLIRVFDGVTDAPFTFFATTPPQPAGTGNPTEVVFGRKVLSMIGNAGILYVSTADMPAANTNTIGGRVMMFDTATGVGTLLGSNPTATKPWPVYGPGSPYTTYGQRIPNALCWHAGRLWVGDMERDSTTVGQIWSIRPGIDTEWTLERVMANGGGVGTLTSYNGELYAGSINTNSQYVEKRDSLGVWTTDLTVATGSTGGWLSGAVFHNTPTTTNLYLALWIPTIATNTRVLKIYQRTAAGIWSIVYAPAAGTLAAPNTMLVQNVVDQVLYVAGGGWGTAGSGLDAFLLTSPDGTTWSNQSSSLTTPSGLSINACYGELTI